MKSLIILIAVAGLLSGASFAGEPPKGFSKDAADSWPKTGKPSVGEVRDGYIVWNGKPFFRNLHHGWAIWQYKHDLFQTYRYYLLCNVASLGSGARQMASAFEEEGVAETTKKDVHWHRIREAGDLYRMKVLTSMYLNGLQYGIPKEMQGLDREAMGKVYYDHIAKVAGGFADVWKSHPGVGGYEISEEYWLPGYHKGSFFPPDSAYRAWLKNKYGTVARMNAEREEDYKSFDDVPIPTDRVSGSMRVNELDYADFLTEDNARRLQVIYDALKKAHPEMLVAAAKGEFGRATWYYAPPCDLYGWYCSIPGGYGLSNVIPRTAAEHFGKAFEIIHVNYCRYANRERDWKEGEQPGSAYGTLGYAHTISEIFEGMKQHWLEDYNDGSFHYFHPTRMIREKGEIRTWSGQKLHYHKDGLTGPDVIVPPSTLGMSAAFAWAHRAAPVFLPTKVEKGNLAVLMTRRSFQGGHDVVARLWRDVPQALRRLHVSYGLVREENVKDLRKYEVLLAGGAARMASSEFVAAVREFVEKGGRLILLPEAFTMDARTSARTPEVRSEMEKLAVARLDDLPPYGNTPARGEYQADWAKALPMYREALDKAGVTTPASIATATGDPLEVADLTLGVLQGVGYWLVGIASFDEKDRAVTLKMNRPTVGHYEVVDVTGERPIVRPDPVSGYALAGDPEYRATRLISKGISGEDLASKGVADIEVKSGMGRILLIRSRGEATRMSCPEYEVLTIALRNVGARVVVGADASQKVRVAASQLADAINAAGGKASLVKDADLKTKQTTWDAVVQPNGAKYQHTIRTFRNEPIDTDTNLVLIGLAANNKVIAHIEKPGTFTYDKVFEKISADYPGPARGHIGVVESVNDPSFDPTDQTRDALIVGGSDDAGTVKAIEKAVAILKANRR